MKRNKDWTRHAGPTGGTCGATWIHTSGAVVHHCGHPTALRPYYGHTNNGTPCYQPNGQAYRHLADCQNETLKQQTTENHDHNAK